MNNKTGSVHWSFWLIGVVTLIFNAMGGMNFLVQMRADSLADFPEFYHPIIEGRPAWATGAFAVAVLGGSLGCLLLLLRKSAACFVFIVSLVGVLLTMIHMFSVVGMNSFQVWIGALMQLVVSTFLVWYSKYAQTKNWLS